MAVFLNLILLNSLIAAAMAVIIWCLGFIPSIHKRPGLRQVLWMLVLLKLITPPLLEISILPAEVRAEPEQLFSPIARPANQPAQLPVTPILDIEVESPTAEPPRQNSRVNWMIVLTFVSGLGTLIVLALALQQVYRFRRELSDVNPPDQRLLGIAQQAANGMGLADAPAVSAVSANIPPLLWVRRSGPQIVIPQRLADQLSDEQLRCVVSHEIAHYLRKDHWTNLFSLFVTALCWWNPVVWWVRRELRTAREACCDALVISRSVAPRRVYAETLYQALEFIQAERALLPVLTSGFGGKTSTQRRFEMIANPQVNHRLSWWCFVVLLVAVVALPCVPVRGDSKPSEANQQSEVSTDQNVLPRKPQLWKLQDPWGSDYYLQMNGFQGQFLEVSFKGGGGMIFDTRNLQRIIEEGGIPHTFGVLTGAGGPGADGFPEWIRAYRFDPEKKEFDGSWLTLSVTDKELGKVAVREVVNADLAAEIRRKASGIPVLLPRDAKVWRLIIDEDLQRPSMKRKDAGKKVEEEPKETAGQKPSPETKQNNVIDLNGLIDAQWRNQGYGIPRVQDGVLHIDWVQPDGLWGYPQNQFNRFTFPQGHSAGFQWRGGQPGDASQFNNAKYGLDWWSLNPDGTLTFTMPDSLTQQLQSKSVAKPSASERESAWKVESVRTERKGSELKMTIDCLAGSDMLDGALDLWQRFFSDATVERIQIMPRTEPKVLIVIKGHSKERSPEGPGAEKSTEKHDPPAERDGPGYSDPPGDQD